MRSVLAVLALAAVIFVVDAARPAATVDAQQPGDLVRLFIQLPDRGQPADDAAVRGAGGRVRHAFPDVNTISIEVPAFVGQAMVERLSARFSNVRPVPTVQAIEDTLPWGVDQVDAERVWNTTENAVDVNTSNDGSGVKVAVIDTGSGPHSDFSIVARVNCITTGCPSGGNDDNGHGTHVAGIIGGLDNETGVIGVAPGASLYSVKVLAANGSGYMDDVAAGVNWARTNGMDIVNMSLGCYYAQNPPACDDPVLRNAVIAAENAGVLLIAAAGNSGTCAGTGDQVGYPAHYDDVVAVGATDSSNQSPCFSSVGPAVELAAPGQSIYATYTNNGYATLSGTSMASPHVAGVAALVMSCDSSLSGPQVRSILNSTATDLGSAGRDTWYGYGLVQADAAVAEADCDGGSPPPPPSPDFSIACSPSSVTVEQGDNGSSTCTVTSTNGFNSAVGLGCTSLLSSVSCGFSPTSVTPPANGTANSTLTLTVGGSVPAGSDSFQVTGTSGTTKSFNMTLNVTATESSTACAAPTITGSNDTSSTGSGTVSFSWNAVPGATLYTVQRQSSSSWSTRATTSSTSYTGSDSSGDPNWRVNVTASDGSCAVPGAYTTFDPAPAPNTGFRDCGANTAVAGGDNNGFEGSASSACTDNSSFATDTNSGTSTSTSCGSSSKDNHDFYNYGFAIPAGATIHGIEVRLDAWIDSTSSSTRRMCVEVSWNGGQSWTAVKQTSNLSSTQSSRILGSASDTWGRTWTAADFSNANFRVRVTNVANSIARDFRLDWVPVRVTYSP